MPARGSGIGVCDHSEGYLRVSRRGPWRDWLVHRKVMYLACLEGCYYPLNGNLPNATDGTPLTVEHLDHNRIHNCLSNLLLLDKRIHDWLSMEHARFLRTVQGPIATWGWVADPEAPDWVNQEEG